MEQMVKIVGINYWQNIGFIEKQDLNLNGKLDQKFKLKLRKDCQPELFHKNFDQQFILS